jgi:hypothetical protein
MFTSAVRLDDADVLLLTGLEPAEIDDLREWYSYTKPIGPSIKIIATAISCEQGFCVVAAGNEPGSAEEIHI